MKKYYDPLDFALSAEIFTVAVIGGFISWKLVTSIYDNFYEPLIEYYIPTINFQKRYITLNNNKKLNIGIIIHDFIKWLIIVFFLMIIYNNII